MTEIFLPIGRNSFAAQFASISIFANLELEGFDPRLCTGMRTGWNPLMRVIDKSIPNVAHLEPQRGGCCTIMPYFIGKIVELPLTTMQDYSLLHMLGESSMERWKQQIDLIREKNGLVSFLHLCIPTISRGNERSDCTNLY